MATDSDHATRVRSAVVTIDKVREEVDDEARVRTLGLAQDILAEYQEGLEADDDA